MTTKIDIAKDQNSNAVNVTFAKGTTLQDFVSHLLNLTDCHGKIYINGVGNEYIRDEIEFVIDYGNGGITNDLAKLIFATYSDYCIKDISGYFAYDCFYKTNFTVYLREGKKESESELIEDFKDGLSDSSYRNRTINIIRDTWVYGVYDKYCSLDLTKLSNQGLHALENSLLNLDYIFNQIEKGRYEE